MEDYKLVYFIPFVIIGFALAFLVYTYSAEIIGKEAYIEALEEELMQCTRTNKTLEETFQMGW